VICDDRIDGQIRRADRQSRRPTPAIQIAEERGTAFGNRSKSG